MQNTNQAVQIQNVKKFQVAKSQNRNFQRGPSSSGISFGGFNGSGHQGIGIIGSSTFYPQHNNGTKRTSSNNQQHNMYPQNS